MRSMDQVMHCVKTSEELLVKVRLKRPILWIGAGLSVAAGYPSTQSITMALEIAAITPVSQRQLDKAATDDRTSFTPTATTSGPASIRTTRSTAATSHICTRPGSSPPRSKSSRDVADHRQRRDVRDHVIEPRLRARRQDRSGDLALQAQAQAQARPLRIRLRHSCWPPPSQQVESECPQFGNPRPRFKPKTARSSPSRNNLVFGASVASRT